MTLANKTKHTDFKQLPLVDLSGLYAADLATRQATAEKLGQAARDADFLYSGAEQTEAIAP